MKTFKEYDEACLIFDKFPGLDKRFLKLVEEIGELIQCHNKNFSNEERIGELGDILFQLSCLARYHGWGLEEVAEYNYKKLSYREEFGR